MTDKFWIWMNNKYYSDGYCLLSKRQKIKEPKTQMLIGYMLEYISYHEKMTPIAHRDNTMILNRMAMVWSCKNIYSELMDIIKYLDEE